MDRYTADVIVIGGGIIGCATAYYLSKRGRSVIVLEASDNIGNGGSSRNGGDSGPQPSCSGSSPFSAASPDAAEKNGHWDRHIHHKKP